jgi:hypothetical protein
MDIVSNVKIYDLEESIIASGYPMRTNAEMRNVEEKDIKRGINLVNATKTGNTAHHQFLTGIRVNFDLTCSNKMWVEAERYRFLEFVSSQSTMHRITKFDLSNQYNKYVDPKIIEIMKEKVKEYNELLDRIESKKNETAEDHDFATPDAEDLYYRLQKSNIRLLEAEAQKKYLEILYSNPAGFTLTARMTTNYRCLRNIYIQRHDHRLPEWREFCKWIETLPYAEEFLIK